MNEITVKQVKLGHTHEYRLQYDPYARKSDAYRITHAFFHNGLYIWPDGVYWPDAERSEARANIRTRA